MPIKKSELYSSIWQSCDELRGGMDPSQYKDYVLVLLFMKYVSDKYAGQKYAPIVMPGGASFQDMVALKGKPDIGDQINKKIVAPLARENKLSDMPDFNDPAKLGDGKEKVDRLTSLIAIFEKPELDFSKNRADGDDILGDAYEYLMRKFATESGKSKGQFYTPAEVSRIMAQLLGIRKAKTSASTTVYDPTAGSGSLLLKVADEAETPVTIYGQEKDATTAGLARMNMILHDYPTAEIVQGNTLADPKFKDGDALKTFDYVVANPPFSDKRWSNGVDSPDKYQRFQSFGTPPGKQGDYAYLLHIVRSLKSTGKGACILPHGVLFRGNAEGEIRRNLVRRGYIKAIIGLPPNLFYGTGIPACIVVVDKEEAQARRGIFMIDASGGFMKDGPKNRLRAMDIHRIVDVYNRFDESDPRYARIVSFDEIEKNEFNLNLPRYIDSRAPEDLQDIDGHLRGGIPAADVDALQRYWDVCPDLRNTLFKHNRSGYVDLAVEKTAIKATIYDHPEFRRFIDTMNAHFDLWREQSAGKLKALQSGVHPKEVIGDLSESLLAHYVGRPLLDRYDVYQHLMDYWSETMQDDVYLIATDGWKAETARVIVRDKKGKEKDKGWVCDLVPKELIVARYFAAEQKAIDELTAELESVAASLAELEEEQGGDEGVFADFDKVNKATVSDRLKEIKGDGESKDEVALLTQWLQQSNREGELKKRLKEAEAGLDAKAYATYLKLTIAEIQSLVVDDKWLAAMDAAIRGEIDRVSHQLTRRVKELADRYETPLPKLVGRVVELEAKVNLHLERMGGATEGLLTGKRRLPGFRGRWREKSLHEIGEVLNGLTFDPRDVRTDGVLVLRSCNVVDRKIDLGDALYVQMDIPSDIMVQPGDILICVRNGSRDLIGKCAMIDDRCVGMTFGAFMAVFRTADREFMFHQFQSDTVRSQIAAHLGATINQITNKSLRSFRVPWPEDAAERFEIGRILSDMDLEIHALEDKLAKLAAVRQAMMQNLLTGQIRLVDVPTADDLQLVQST